MNTSRILVWIILAFVAVASAGKNGRKGKERKAMKNRFNKVHSPLFNYLYPEFAGYDKNLRPYYKGEPVRVTLSTYIRDISDYCTHKGEITLQLTLRMSYTDPRLAANLSPVSPDSNLPAPPSGNSDYVTLVGEETKQIWLPDVFVRNSRSASVMGMLAPETMARISPSGEVMYSARVNLVTACHELITTTEEEETVTCRISLASYGLSSNDLILDWAPEDPIQFDTDHLDIKGGATLEGVHHETGSVETSSGTFNWAGMNLTFMKAE